MALRAIIPGGATGRLAPPLVFPYAHMGNERLSFSVTVIEIGAVMPFKTQYGSHYHMTEGCHGATIPCDTKGLVPCSDCCGTGDGQATGGMSHGESMASGMPGGTGGHPNDESDSKTREFQFGGQEPAPEADGSVSGDSCQDDGTAWYLKGLTRAFTVAELGVNCFADSQDAPRPVITDEEVVDSLAGMEVLPDSPETPSLMDRAKRRLWGARGWSKEAIAFGLAGGVPSGAEFVGFARGVAIFSCPDEEKKVSLAGMMRRMPFLPVERDTHRRVMAIDSTGKDVNAVRRWQATPLADALVAGLPPTTRLVGSSPSASLFVTPSSSEPNKSVDLVYVPSGQRRQSRPSGLTDERRRTIRRTTIRMERYYGMTHKGWDPETMMYAIAHDVPASYDYCGRMPKDASGDKCDWVFSYYDKEDGLCHIKAMDSDGTDITGSLAGGDASPDGSAKADGRKPRQVIDLPVTWELGEQLPDGRLVSNAWYSILSGSKKK